MRGFRIPGILMLTLLGGVAAAQGQELEPSTRQGVIEREQADKVDKLRPYDLNRGERIFARIQDRLVNQRITWYPFLENAYSGGGLALGLGYRRPVSAYNHVDVRGSYSVRSYKLAEAEFVAPRLFHRRGELSILGGWRDAPEVGFYAPGSDPSSDLHLSYGFEESRGSALLSVWPTRRLMLRGGLEVSRWDLKSGSGSFPSIDTRFTPDTLAGVAQATTYVHPQVTVGVDNRKWVDVQTSPGYARRGGFYGVTAHDFTDQDSRFGFRQIDYEAVNTFRSCARHGSSRCAAVPKRPRGRTISRCRSTCCRRSAAGTACAAFRAGGSAAATACCCRASGGSSSTAVSRPRCSTTPEKWRSARRISTSTA